MVQNSIVSGVQPGKVSNIVCKSPVNSSALCNNNIFVRTWINLKSKYYNRLNLSTEIRGLSYFTIQIQSWIFETNSKSNRIPDCF